MLEMIMKLYYNIITSTSNHTNISTSHPILLLPPLLPQKQMDTIQVILYYICFLCYLKVLHSSSRRFQQASPPSATLSSPQSHSRKPRSSVLCYRNAVPRTHLQLPTVVVGSDPSIYFMPPYIWRFLPTRAS